MKYRKEIDGLRAIAVLPVIFFHAGSSWFGGGFVGVDIFFVISGYLITSILLAEHEAGTFSIYHFYERRARRILPALFLVMFVTLPFAWYWMLPYQLKEFSDSLLAVSTSISNILFWKQSGYFDISSELKPLLHTWSLAVEEQYYVFFPIFLFLFWSIDKGRGIWLKGVLIAAAFFSLVFAQRMVTEDASFAFYLLPTRGWELLIGALIPVIYSINEVDKTPLIIRQAMSFAGLILIAYALFYFDSHTPFPSVYALIPTIGAALILRYSDGQTFVARILSHPLLVGVGVISYSAYLWHQPILAFFRIKTGLIELPKLMFIPYFALVFVLAFLSYRFVEVPFRSRKITTRKQILIVTLFCTCFFVSLGYMGHISKGFYSWKLSLIPLEKRNLIIDIDNERKLREQAFQNNQVYLRHSTFSQKIQERKVVVVGDSMGVDLSLAFVENKNLFPNYEFRYLELTNDCLDALSKAVSRDCQKARNAVLSSNLLKESNLVIVTFLWKDSADFNDIKKFLSDIKNINNKILVLGSAGFLDIASIAYKVAADNHPYTQNDMDELIANSRRNKFDIGNNRIQTLVKELNLSYRDRHDLYCNVEKNKCRILYENGDSNIWDNAHLTKLGRKVTSQRIFEFDWLGMNFHAYDQNN